MKKILKLTLITIIVLGVLAFLFIWLTSEKEPKGQDSKEADILAQKIMEAVDIPAWDTTKFLSWSFAGEHDYIWDKTNHDVHISWDENTVLMHTKTQEVRAYQKGQEITDSSRKKELKEKAWSHWCNDSYWLNPIAKFYDPGVTREIIKDESGKELLKITHSDGGVTPGDSYVWAVDENYRPIYWKMWVKIIPQKGMKNSWSGWTELSTGAWVSTTHSFLGKDVELIQNPRAAQTLSALGQDENLFLPINK